jgi:hypothetical protein
VRCPFREKQVKDTSSVRHAFLFGIAGIPHSAKSVCGAGTSTHQVIEISEVLNRSSQT